MAVTVTQSITQRSAPPERYGATVFVELSTLAAFTTEEHAKTAGLEAKIRTYTSSTDITDENEDMQDALKGYFGAESYPAKAYVITQVFTARPSVLLSQDLDPDLIEGLGDGAAISLAGKSITGVNLDTKTTLAAQATELARAINAHADFSGISITVIDSKFLITIPSTIDIGDGFGVAGKVKTALPLNKGNLEVNAPRFSVSETATIAATRLREDEADPRQQVFVGTPFYTDQTDETVLQRIKAWNDVGAGQEIISHVRINRDNNPEDQSAGNLLYDLNQLTANKQYISAFYTHRNDQKHAGYGAVFSGINFNLTEQHLNGAGRDLKGFNADRLSDELIAALDAQKCNYYLDTAGYKEVIGGTNLTEWTDVIYVAAWVKRSVRNAARDLRKSVKALPPNQDSRALMLVTLNNFFKRMDRGGFVRVGGSVSAEQKETIAGLTGSNFDGTLSSGFLVHIEAPNKLSESERTSRKFMQIYYWVLYTGSSNDIAIEGSFIQ